MLPLCADFAADREVCLAGRILSRRIMGKASFAELQSPPGRIQIYLNRDELCPGEDKAMYNTVFKKLLDRGDIIGIKGTTFTTQTGEPSVLVKELTVLSKSIRPLPSVKTDEDGKVYDAFTDPELRHRMRYVDLVVNPEVKRTFEARSRVIQAMRDAFTEKGWLKWTPRCFRPFPAALRPSIHYPSQCAGHSPLSAHRQRALSQAPHCRGLRRRVRILPQLPQRGHGPDPQSGIHRHGALRGLPGLPLDDGDHRATAGTCLQSRPWHPHGHPGGSDHRFCALYRRLSMRDAILEHAGVDIDGMDEAALRGACADLGIEVDDSMGKGKLIDEIFGEKCEHHLVQPTFITDYPVEMSPLTKAHRDKPGYTERFELFINGTEVANAYSELNDPITRASGSKTNLRLANAGTTRRCSSTRTSCGPDRHAPTSGVGIGVDRLVMMLTDQRSIQEVLFFRQMRPEVFRSGPDLGALEALGVPAEWAPHVAAAGFDTPDAIREAKPTALREKLNGFRKKNKLDLPALQLEEVESWSA